MNLLDLFKKPTIIAIIADVNAGKTMTLMHILETIKANATFELYTYGLRAPFDFGNEIFSLDELEVIQNSVIVIDEVMTLFDLDSRPKRKAIENSLRLINHSNNILILSAVPENMKKFLCGKVNTWIFKKSTIGDFINGSMAKRIVQAYSGYEKGTTVLNMPIDRALVYNGANFKNIHIPYYASYDTKAGNQAILKMKKGGKI